MCPARYVYISLAQKQARRNMLTMFPPLTVINPTSDAKFTINWMKNVYNSSIIKASSDKPRLEAENFPTIA